MVWKSSFALVSSFVFLSSLQAQQPKVANAYWVYFGTYTSKGGSEGIYRSVLNAETGELGQPEVAAKLGSPSFLHIGPNGQSLYAVGESNSNDGGGVYSFQIDPKTGELSKQVSLTSGGNGPCHISCDAEQKFAVVANYGGGSSAIFKLKENGDLDSRTSFQQHEGKSINPARQQGPHAHSGFFSKDGTLAFVPDLGLDKVLIFKIDRTTGKAAPHDPAFIAIEPGAGPRHIHLADDQTVAFVCGEMNMTVNVIRTDFANNTFKVIQSLSTTPEGKPTPGGSTAEVRIHPNGQFVYVSNRGHNTIAVFAYDAKSMSLKAVGHIRGKIKTPRNFNITPCGKWMLIANQDGGTVGVYQIDLETGMATETKSSIEVSRPVCVKFLAKSE